MKMVLVPLMRSKMTIEITSLIPNIKRIIMTRRKTSLMVVLVYSAQLLI
jgi:hypothetical protein